MKKIISGVLLVSILASGINAKMIRVDSKNIVYDTDTNLFWQDDPASINITKDWDDAKTYCENLTLSGYSDWKLPDTDNNTLYDLIEKTYAFKNFTLASYWSSTESTKYKEDARMVDFEGKGSYQNSKSRILNVKCIRAAQANDLSLFTADIKKAIQEETQKKANSEKDDKAWELAQKENSIVSYRNYLKQYSNGKYTKSANENLSEKLKKLDLETWNSASSQNTIASYKAYLKQFPNGEYASSARSNIEELSPARIAQRKREAEERERQARERDRQKFQLGNRVCYSGYTGNSGWCGTIENISGDRIQVELTNVTINGWGIQLNPSDCSGNKALTYDSRGKYIWVPKYCTD